MTPDAYQWPTDPRITDLEAEANTLAASLRLAATLIRPNRESQP